MEEANKIDTNIQKPNPFSTVTTLSKAIAMLIFVAFPFIGFWLGIKYQEQKGTIAFNDEFVRYLETGASTKKTLQATPSKSPIMIDTSNWKTYTNDVGGYLIKYPKDYELNPGKKYSVDGVSIDDPSITSILSPDFPKVKSNFQLTISYNATKETNVRNYIDKNSWCDSITPDSGKQYLLGGAAGLIYEETPCGPWGSTDIYVIKNGYIYHVEIESPTGLDSMRPYFEQILATFVFTR